MMKNNFKYCLLFLIIMFTGCNAEKKSDKTILQDEPVFQQGGKIISNNFAGTAWLNWLVPNDSIFNCPVGNVTFEPGARTNWHKHPGGQILLITGGQGYYQERSES